MSDSDSNDDFGPPFDRSKARRAIHQVWTEAINGELILTDKINSMLADEINSMLVDDVGAWKSRRFFLDAVAYDMDGDSVHDFASNKASSRLLGTRMGQLYANLVFVGDEIRKLQEEGRQKAAKSSLAADAECHICCEAFTSHTSEESSSASQARADRFPVLLKCCGASVCRECAEKHRAAEVAALPRGRQQLRRIPCMQCKEPFDPESGPWYVLNRPHAASLGRSRKRVREEDDDDDPPTSRAAAREDLDHARSVQRVLDGANKKVEASRTKMDAAKEKKDTADSTLNTAQRAFDEAKNALKASKLAVRRARDAADKAGTEAESASADFDSTSKNASKVKEGLDGLMG